MKQLVRSMTIIPFQSSEMSLMLWISLILTYDLVAGKSAAHPALESHPH